MEISTQTDIKSHLTLLDKNTENFLIHQQFEKRCR